MSVMPETEVFTQIVFVLQNFLAWNEYVLIGFSKLCILYNITRSITNPFLL